MTIARADFEAESLGRWGYVERRLFPFGVPDRAHWTKLDTIVAILNALGRTESFNHMFFPGGGGMDLHAARLGNESETMLLDCGILELVKPTQLSFESFSGSPDWTYFRLETNGLEPTGLYDLDDDEISEEVVEYEPGKYTTRRGWDDGVIEHPDLGVIEAPDAARVITRFFRGSFVIFAKASIYNDVDPYNGDHDKVTAEQFRKRIQRTVDRGISKTRK